MEAAIQARRWTAEDARVFRATLADMTPPQREEAIRRLMTTLNSQELEVQTRGAPF